MAKSPLRHLPARGLTSRMGRASGSLERALGWHRRGHKAGDSTIRFHTRVAVLIACVSMVGAVAAWRASVHANQASDYDQQEIQERSLKAQLDMRFAAAANEDSRLVPLYQYYIADSIAASQEADAIRVSQPQLAAQFDAQALQDLRQAQTVRELILWPPEDPNSTSLATIQPQPDNLIAYFRQADDEYSRLEPDLTHALGLSEHQTAHSLIELVGILITALVFLTLAHLAETERRIFFQRAGAAIALIATAMLAVIDWQSIPLVIVVAAFLVVASTVLMPRAAKAAAQKPE